MSRSFVLFASCLLVAACSDSQAAARPSDGVLVLEVGGIDTSLRKTLTDAGVEVAPPQRLLPEDVEPEPASPGGSGSGAGGGAGPGANEPPPPSPPPNPEPSPQPTTNAEWFEVELAPKQTLTGLAKKHLGDGTRYPEIMKLNGWSEREVLKLRPGAKVKIPKQKR